MTKMRVPFSQCSIKQETPEQSVQTLTYFVCNSFKLELDTVNAPTPSKTETAMPRLKVESAPVETDVKT